MNDGGYGKMKAYKDLNKEELRALQTELQAAYEKLSSANSSFASLIPSNAP